jgi:DUF971 family protein
MSSITRFNIDSRQRMLTVELSETATWEFPMEYLRVIDLNGITTSAKQTLVTNKKEVQLNNIESVGKHGYRLCFDDNYQVILNEQEFKQLHAQQETLWLAYLDAIKNSGLTRETAIDIKAL